MERNLSPSDRGRRRRQAPIAITGTDLGMGGGHGAQQASAPSCVITTDNEAPRLARQSSQVQSIELRKHTMAGQSGL
jgi:hypothetical protein